MTVLYQKLVLSAGLKIQITIDQTKSEPKL